MKEAFVKNAADVDQVREAKRKERWAHEDHISDMAWILSDVRGRRVLWKYLEHCGLFQTSFTGNSTTFFNEGMRNIGLKLIADITTASPESYFMMMKEAQARDGRVIKEKDADESGDD